MERRDALVVIGATPLAAQHQHNATPSAPTAPAKLRYFTKEQHALVDELAEMIIPADPRSGGAREAKVAAYIDDLVADANDATKQAWAEGLKAVDTEATRRHKKTFTACSKPQRNAIMATMAEGEESPKTPLHHFFARLKTQTQSGYYTSPIGLLKDLQYKGIVPLAAYPPCDHPDHQLVERKVTK